MTDRYRSALHTLPWIAALVAGAGGILAVAPAFSAQPSKVYNNNAPVNYAADRIEVQDKVNRVVLTGNVDVTQDTMRLRAARVTVSYTNTGSLQIQQMVATGGVVVTRANTAGGTDTAHGDVGVYDVVSRIVTMSGNVTINRAGGDTLRGGRAVMNLATGMSTIDSRPSGTAPGPGTNGRVSGTFSVQQSK